VYSILQKVIFMNGLPIWTLNFAWRLFNIWRNFLTQFTGFHNFFLQVFLTKSLKFTTTRKNEHLSLQTAVRLKIIVRTRTKRKQRKITGIVFREDRGMTIREASIRNYRETSPHLLNVISCCNECIMCNHLYSSRNIN